jgi:hypothetical protein
MVAACAKTPFVAAVQTDVAGHSRPMSLNRVKGFRSKKIAWLELGEPGSRKGPAPSLAHLATRNRYQHQTSKPASRRAL